MNRIVPAALLALAVTACSGGGGGEATAPASAASVDQGIITMPSDQRAPAPRSEPVPVTLDGAWSGSLINRDVQVLDAANLLCHVNDSAADCLLIRDGELSGALRGSLELSKSGSSVKVTGIIYGSDSTSFESAWSEIVLRPTEADTIRAGLDLENYVLSLGRSNYGANLPSGDVDGLYVKAEFDGEASSLTVDSDGTLFAQAANGCVYAGQINGSAATIDVTSCGERTGEYAATVIHSWPLYIAHDDASHPPGTLLGFVLYNDEHVITGYGTKD